MRSYLEQNPYSFLGGSIQDRRNEAGVSRAAAEMPFYRLANLSFRRLRVAAQQSRRRNHESRRAVAALYRMILSERFLQSRQLIRKPLKPGYCPPRRLHRQHETRTDRLGNHQDAARPAISFATRNRCAQSEAFAK